MFATFLIDYLQYFTTL